MPASMLQLDPALPVMAFRNGEWHKAMAHGWMDYGIEDDLFWICFVDDCEPWVVSNRHIRAQSNITIGRKPSADIALPRKKAPATRKKATK
jgi:hypothetical protein